MLERFSQREPPCEVYDEKMHFYSIVEADIAAHPKDKQVKFILLHVGSLAKSLQNISRSWVVSLGKLLNEAARNNLIKLTEEMDVCVAMLIFSSIFMFLIYEHVGAVYQSHYITRYLGELEICAWCNI